MDEAAAARIRKARGEQDEFARRAAVAARTNKDNSAGGQTEQRGGSGQSGASQVGADWNQGSGSESQEAGSSSTLRAPSLPGSSRVLRRAHHGTSAMATRAGTARASSSDTMDASWVH
ncbi:predicted protein [Verticillium alfalfae VaMs.102]|uniref:Predicted protein n=1 Tax=Verticillium alfalfae (strain VaMs.102 / ATCC MYA-4576 / FGSC 10136) TaxID=526221 RepID=C9SXR5_VERA1|nr:predicted protein [Verticillium alfalfae VaMs.102]EEY23580.1 predicted protein [Verticillium alfalfae VaMs.102]